MGYSPARTHAYVASAARTATANFNPLNTPAFAAAVRFRISVTASAATPSVVYKVQGRTPAGAWEDLLASAAVTGTSETVLTVGRGLTAAANVTANGVVPSAVRLRAEHADADSITYSVSAEFFG